MTVHLFYAFKIIVLSEMRLNILDLLKNKPFKNFIFGGSLESP